MSNDNSNRSVKKENLISLVWPPNTCCSTLIEGVPQGVIVNELAGTWTFMDKTYPIGSKRRYPCPEDTGYPVNVYDRTKLEHLQQLQTDVEWVKTRNQSISFED
jgi:hypothetical protein